MKKLPHNYRRITGRDQKVTNLISSEWRESPPDVVGYWLEWDGYNVNLWDVEDRQDSKEVWIFQNNFWRMCSEIKNDSKWLKITPPR